ncbi:BrnA antitoxin family protein [Rhizobium sp. LjRoot254]|uniref:BrnA antitoxin family protein n=1 Tax=Rhizobium sp. LjRoot254 TaxID=3342297 RepID=UPI003ED0EE84
MSDRSTKRLSAEELDAELARLEAMRDEDIDTSDIPEITDAQWKTAIRGRDRTIEVTLPVYATTIEWFKNNSENADFKSEINRVLRQYVIDAVRKAG